MFHFLCLGFHSFHSQTFYNLANQPLCHLQTPCNEDLLHSTIIVQFEMSERAFNVQSEAFSIQTSRFCIIPNTVLGKKMSHCFREMKIPHLRSNPSFPNACSFPTKQLDEVLGNCLHKVRCCHKNGYGADDVENAECHQTKSVDYGCSKLPLFGHAVVLILSAEPISNVSHLF